MILWLIDYKTVSNSPLFPLSTSSAIWLCSNFHQEIKSISPRLLWLAMANRIEQKGSWTSSEPRLQEALHASALPFKTLPSTLEQAQFSLWKIKDIVGRARLSRWAHSRLASQQPNHQLSHSPMSKLSQDQPSLAKSRGTAQPSHKLMS